MNNYPHKTLSNGECFNILDPDPKMIDIEYIAKVLSNINRFGGDARYSVAQHVINCRKFNEFYHPDDYELQIATLCHDNGEAYIGDHITPQKRFTYIKSGISYVPLSTVEDNILEKINKKLEINTDIFNKNWIKIADVSVAIRECSLLLPNRKYDIDRNVPVYTIPKTCDFSYWPPEKAEIIFVRTFYKLKRLINGNNTKKNNNQNIGNTSRRTSNKRFYSVGY